MSITKLFYMYRKRLNKVNTINDETKLYVKMFFYMK